MLDTSQNWQLFGYDASQLGRRWTAAWRDFLWSSDSPVRQRLDEVVRLRDGDKLRYFHCDREVPEVPVECDAVLLPESLVLSRLLRLPLAAESELDAVMSLEVHANSPFPEDDTGFGWRVMGRNEQNLEVQLVIVSLSSTMSYLGSEFDLHDPRAQEVWAEFAGVPIMLHGFGEQRRQDRYRRRLLRVAGMCLISGLVLLAMVALSAGTKFQELRQVRTMYASVQEQAADASAMRSSLVSANETIAAVNTLILNTPSPHHELARLTAILGDEAYISQFVQQGHNITLRGRARDAASVMQQFTSEPAYEAVTAPDAFRVSDSSGLEEFHFRITLAGEPE